MIEADAVGTKTMSEVENDVEVAGRKSEGETGNSRYGSHG
jgi:hypothetical protein